MRVHGLALADAEPILFLIGDRQIRLGVPLQNKVPDSIPGSLESALRLVKLVEYDLGGCDGVARLRISLREGQLDIGYLNGKIHCEGQHIIGPRKIL